MNGSTPLRTRFYVDGYNLYFGCLKGSLHKWLNVLELCSRVLETALVEREGAPLHFEVDRLGLKYFTSSILKRFARAADSVECQASYEMALGVHLNDRIKVIKGYYDAREARAPRCVEGVEPRACELVDIWKLEEKQTDVALGLHAFRDVVMGDVDHVVFVTNDTDLAPAFQMIREETTAIVGHIVPSRQPDDAKHRRANAALSNLAHWTRQHLTDSELAASQLPTNVPGPNPINKPVSWYPRPDLLEPILIEAKKVRGSKNAAWKWLNAPCAWLSERRPIDMTGNDREAAELKAYMAAYKASQFKATAPDSEPASATPNGTS